MLPRMTDVTMPAVGEPAPDFTLLDQDDEPVTLSGLGGQ